MHTSTFGSLVGGLEMATRRIWLGATTVALDRALPLRSARSAPRLASMGFHRSPDTPALDVRQNLTVGAWFNVADIPLNFPGRHQGAYERSILDSLERARRQVSMVPIRFRVNLGPDNPVNSSQVVLHDVCSNTRVAYGQFIHVAGTHDGATIKIYINGILENSATAIGQIASDPRPLTFGAGDNALYGSGIVNSLHGLVDEVQIYSRTLTDAEVSSLFLAGSGGQCKGSALPMPTISWQTPTAIVYGTRLTDAQLNATASINGSAVAGTFAYTPALGTLLSAGSHTLSVIFAPADLNSYSVATATVPLTVTQATPVANITGGQFVYNGSGRTPAATATGVKRRTVSGSVTFTYVPGGAVPPVDVGTYTATAAFASADPNYGNAISNTVLITITPATPTLKFSGPFTYDGTPHVPSVSALERLIIEFARTVLCDQTCGNVDRQEILKLDVAGTIEEPGRGEIHEANSPQTNRNNDGLCAQTARIQPSHKTRQP